MVCINAKEKTFNDIQDIPFNEAGLLLGTSPVTSNGEHNYYFDERIKATATLYHSGKIKRIIASGGDYSNNGGCNELIAMRDSLIKQEVPDSVISLERAIYLAEHYGLQAVAYNATMPNIAKKKIRNISREFLARVKLFIDLMSSE